MTFNANIPQAGDFLSVSQIDMLRNFNTMNSIFERDHTPLGEGLVEDRGKHVKLDLPSQAADPVTAANVQALYTKDTAGIPELYSRLENSGTVDQWTKNGRISPGLRLQAYVIFDSQGNILQNPDGSALSHNVTNITIPNALVGGINIYDDWIVNFTTAITTQYYFWTIGAFYGISPITIQPVYVVTAPWKFGTYANTVQTTSLRVSTKTILDVVTAAVQMTQIIQVQIFTVI